MAGLDKRFKAFSFIWLLFCFFATAHYADYSDMDSLFRKIFLYGVFAAPVWLNYGWFYLYGDRSISKLYLFIIASLFLFWAVAEAKSGYNAHGKDALAALSGVYFLFLAYPYTSLPAIGRIWCRLSQITSSQLLLPNTSNRYRYYGMRLGLLIIIALASLIVVAGFAAAQHLALTSLVMPWLEILVLAAITLFARPIGFQRKMAYLASVVLGYWLSCRIASYLLLNIVPSFIASPDNQLETVFQLMKVSAFINVVFYAASIAVLVRWLRRGRPDS